MNFKTKLVLKSILVGVLSVIGMLAFITGLAGLFVGLMSLVTHHHTYIVAGIMFSAFVALFGSVYYKTQLDGRL